MPLAGERKFKTSKHTRSQCSENQGEGENADGERRAKTEAQAERGAHRLLRVGVDGSALSVVHPAVPALTALLLGGAGGLLSREENVLEKVGPTRPNSERRVPTTVLDPV